MTLPPTGDQKIPFHNAETIFGDYAADDMVSLATSAADFIIAIDHKNVVRDISLNQSDQPLVKQWLGKKWADTVTIECKGKIEQLLDLDNAGDNKWRQVNHQLNGANIPVNYKVFRPKNSEYFCAIGRDMRAVSELQQRLLKTQQSMERDYLTLRQTETRYRLLFDNIAYPVMIARASDYKIERANSACHKLMAMLPSALEGKALLDLLDADSRATFIAYSGAVSVNGKTEPVELCLKNSGTNVRLSAAIFRQYGEQYWLIDIDTALGDGIVKRSDDYILDVVEKMPDAFVLADDDQNILVVNRAFSELVQAGSAEQLVGQPLSNFFGRPNVDLNLLRKQLQEYSHVRNFGSVVNDLNGGEEAVEISAIMVERDRPVYGYSVRSIGRRERDLPASGNELPRSVDQLTNLVGRRSLREIVRESTDLIERMCIEAALVHTSDNRASAAEILGLSRQSLYSKLHRHGLGNLSSKD
jgi:transcriptional regulator PpsR